MKMSIQESFLSKIPAFVSTLQLADTSVSEEEVLEIVGQTNSGLPDPFFTVLIASIIVFGVAVLQFSLGDLTKEVSLLLKDFRFPHFLLIVDHIL